MEADCYAYVKKCHKCQVYANLIHVPPSQLHSLTSPWPFSVWGIDIIGKISPKSSSGHEYILVAIDYFTKWIEAASYASLTSASVARTSIRSSTGATPYSLVYGMEAVLPVELRIPSLRVMMEAGLPESVWAQARYQELQMIDEKRLKALYHVQGYQRRVERAFNKKVRVRDLKKGDLVLKSFRAPWDNGKVEVMITIDLSEMQFTPMSALWFVAIITLSAVDLIGSLTPNRA
ncbi:uncharacterized protein LOC143888539 [Tasmannia lanceolata]|uniref:uncharacterized protein LOC143888539 n=1 Tax=Tasmannia lanceolata TaxID=3420 RepID=UPI0040633993